jgi:ABC-2 type transport system ATP-binding protein
MARRLGLAQALINEPDLLLLDEPTSGLDPLAARAIKDLIREVAGGGCTVLLSSHLLGDVEDLCEAVTVLESGRVVARGGVAELLEERDALEVRLENPPPDARDRVERALEGTPGRVASARPPRRRLEDLFHDLLRGRPGR